MLKDVGVSSNCIKLQTAINILEYKAHIAYSPLKTFKMIILVLVVHCYLIYSK